MKYYLMKVWLVVKNLLAFRDVILVTDVEEAKRMILNHEAEILFVNEKNKHAWFVV